MKTEFVNFRCDVEHPLPHPETSCICQFIGKAKIEIETLPVDFGTGGVESRIFRTVEILELWLAIDPPIDPTPDLFKQVSTPDYNHFLGVGEWQQLLPLLESAALDQYDYCLHRVTLPSEIAPIDRNGLSRLETSNLFK